MTKLVESLIIKRYMVTREIHNSPDSLLTLTQLKFHVKYNITKHPENHVIGIQISHETTFCAFLMKHNMLKVIILYANPKIAFIYMGNYVKG